MSRRLTIAAIVWAGLSSAMAGWLWRDRAVVREERDRAAAFVVRHCNVLHIQISELANHTRVLKVRPSEQSWINVRQAAHAAYSLASAFDECAIDPIRAEDAVGKLGGIAVGTSPATADDVAQFSDELKVMFPLRANGDRTVVNRLRPARD